MIIYKTWHYILNVEVKTSISRKKTTSLKSKTVVESVLEQIAGAKKTIEDWFGADLTIDWKFIGAIFTTLVEPGVDICLGCSQFTMVGEEEIIQKMK